jgi:pimeloyl-ACP methyl ester carboxylesterase
MSFIMTQTSLHQKKLSIFNDSGLYINSYSSYSDEKNLTPILCFHGWLDNASSFFPLIDTLPSVPWCATDLIGHGYSSWRAPGSFYYFWDYLCDTASLIQTHFPRGVHVLGHSLGSGVALLIAGLLPKLVHSVALLDGLGPLVSQTDHINQEFRFSMQQHEHALQNKRLYPSIEAMAIARQKSHQIALDSCRILAQYGHIQTDSGLLWSFDPRLFILPPFQMIEEQVLGIISDITVPVLVLQAASGYKVDTDFFQRRQNALQHVLEHHIVPGYHHAHLDNPSVIVPFLERFWSELVKS